MTTLGVTGRYASDLALALAMADEADVRSMSRYRADDLVISTKPDSTPVTEADEAVERMIRATLAEQRPDDDVVGEEFGGDTGDGRRWIVDPIDGTKNYLRGVPVWSTLLSLAIDSEVVVGVVSAPALGRRWWAAEGAGAWTRDVDGSVRRLRVSAVSHIADASFSFSDAVDWDRHSSTPGALQRIIDATWRQRGYGDFLSHVLVAEGAVDIAAEPTLAPWDMAALVPIIQEAGGRATGFRGGDPLEQLSLVCTNGLLHDVALEHILF
jgi:histidinol-phosphatase